MSVEQEIEECIHKSGKGYPSWYVGISDDPREQLFAGHNVNEKAGLWIYRDAGSEFSAREIQSIFLKKGCKGGLAGGELPHFVYAYRMTPTTWGSKI